MLKYISMCRIIIIIAAIFSARFFPIFRHFSHKITIYTLLNRK